MNFWSKFKRKGRNKFKFFRFSSFRTRWIWSWNFSFFLSFYFYCNLTWKMYNDFLSRFRFHFVKLLEFIDIPPFPSHHIILSLFIIPTRLNEYEYEWVKAIYIRTINPHHHIYMILSLCISLQWLTEHYPWQPWGLSV